MPAACRQNADTAQDPDAAALRMDDRQHERTGSVERILQTKDPEEFSGMEAGGIRVEEVI